MPIDPNLREFEITSHISLARLDPLALAELLEEGECDLSLPETLFDSDCPGHYMRQLKLVSLTVPCAVGPYTGENVTITFRLTRQWSRLATPRMCALQYRSRRPPRPRTVCRRERP